MSIPRYAALAARLLRENLDVGFRGRAGERQRSLQTIERALNAAERRRWYVRGAFTGLALAASVAVWFTVQQLDTFSAERGDGAEGRELEVSVRALPLGSGATLFSASGEVALLPGTQLAVGDRVATEQHGGAVLSLSSGTHLELGADSNFVVQSENRVQRFSLDRGSLQANVATLHQGQRFVVDTPEAQVEVRGTEFRLRLLETAAVCVPPLAAGAGDGRAVDSTDEALPEESEVAPSRVRLWVREGVVEVRSRGTTTRVAAGEAWPADCIDEEAHLEQGTADRRSAADARTVDARAVDARAADAKTIDARTADAPTADGRTADESSAGERARDADARVAEGHGPEAQTAEGRSVGEGSGDERTATGQRGALEAEQSPLNSGARNLDAANGARSGQNLPAALRRASAGAKESGAGTQRAGTTAQEASQELGSSANASRTPPPKGVPSAAARRAEEAEQEAAALARNAASRGEGKGDKSAERGSALAAQTRLFAQGVQSRQQGDSASALAAFQELLTRYPDSALAENAIVERMRLLQARDPAAARREAERYLQRYPRGFARREAEPLAKKR